MPFVIQDFDHENNSKHYKTSKNHFSFFIYIVIVIGILLSSTLLWSYVSAKNAVNQELLKLFKHEYRIAQNVLEQEIYALDHFLRDCQYKKYFLETLDKVSSQKGEQNLFHFVNYEYHFRPDIILISKPENPIWINCCLKTHNIPLKSLKNIITMKRKSLRRWQIYYDKDSKFFYILKSGKLILKNGKVMGILIAGTILNNNVLLYDRIRRNTKTLSILLQGGNQIIGYACSKRMIRSIENIVKQQKYKQIIRHTIKEKKANIILYKQQIEFFGQKTPLKICIIKKDNSIDMLRENYIKKTFALIFIAFLFICITLYFGRKTVFPSLNKLIDYTNKITQNNFDAKFIPGIISEANQLGEAMEQMVCNLKKTYDDLHQQILHRKNTEKHLRKAQEHLNTLNKELEARVERRTLQLRKANKELEAFSYSISHDLRTPIRHIQGFCQMLSREESISQKGKDYIKVIIDSSQRMALLIDSLLEFSRMQRIDICKKTINMNKIVEQIMQETLFERKDIIWKKRKLPSAEGDPILIMQVWTNLISNAVKYSKKNPVICINSFCKEKSSTIYYIKDNGVGFNMKYSNKLFEVFQRLHSSREFEGIGIGLALAKKIIEKHGGQMWGKGRPGKGAVFFSHCPIKEK